MFITGYPSVCNGCGYGHNEFVGRGKISSRALTPSVCHKNGCGYYLAIVKQLRVGTL